MPPPLIVALLLLCIVSCSPASQQDKLKKDLTGDWLVLYADHKLTNDEQRALYGKMQDSIIAMRGLKLVQFFGDGSFLQLDSLGKKGRWTIADNNIYIIEGGKGFNNFKTEFFDYKDDILRTVEYVNKEGNSIKLVWHLKKINGSSLFKDNKNAWRKKPQEPETDEQIKKRLSDMLGFYADYYRLLSKESSYFIPARVIIPFNFYQHAMGLKEFDGESAFARLFNNQEQAQKAYYYLNVAMTRLTDQYPKGGSFVDEYANYMEMLSNEVLKQSAASSKQ
jgi:hypothetical protein